MLIELFLNVQSAFFAVRVFPPPAAGAYIFTHGYCACAGCAADAWVKLVM
jgi:hypothetical protein